MVDLMVHVHIDDHHKQHTEKILKIFTIIIFDHNAAAIN